MSPRSRHSHPWLLAEVFVVGGILTLTFNKAFLGLNATHTILHRFNDQICAIAISFQRQKLARTSAVGAPCNDLGMYSNCAYNMHSSCYLRFIHISLKLLRFSFIP